MPSDVYTVCKPGFKFSLSGLEYILIIIKV